MNPQPSLNALQSILETLLPQMEQGKFSKVECHFVRALLELKLRTQALQSIINTLTKRHQPRDIFENL